jgi:glyoxylase-like metal-dependent hydrolase (beta-lactamase superfamily II)
MKVGALEILPVLDGTTFLPISEPFLNMPVEAWDAHREFLTADGQVEIALGGFLVRGNDRVVLVDTGAGKNSSVFSGGAFLTNLATYGVTPEEVTDVVFTHLHFDHVGWATQQGRVVFENATYRCDGRDWAYFVGPDPGATRKLTPIADRVVLWDQSGPVVAGIDALTAPGHTPGSTIIVVSSGTDRAILLGDVAHCPLELEEEEWNGMGDVDPELAQRTRNAIARELEGTDTPVSAAHFPGLRFGRVLRGEGKRMWVVP